MDAICRLCGLNSSDLVPIFSFSNGRLISDLIIVLIPVKIDNSENLPKNICKKCLELIENIHKLRNKSIRNDDEFRQPSFQEKFIKQDTSNAHIEKVPIIPEVSLHDLDLWNEGASTSSFMNDNYEDTNDNTDNDTEWSMPSEIKPKSTDKNKRHECEHCEASFRYKAMLVKHIRHNHKEFSAKLKGKPANCSICGLYIPQACNLKRHIMQYHDNSLPYGCPQCSYRFADPKPLKHHGIKFHNMLDIAPVIKETNSDEGCVCTCDLCGKRFLDKSAISLHISRKHLKHVIKKRVDKLYISGLNYECEYCDKKFTTRGNMYRHYQHSHSPELPYQCNLCNEGFRTKRIYAKHMEKVHLVENDDISPQPRVSLLNQQLVCEYCCFDCGTSKYQYERHMILSHEDQLKNVYSCGNCTKKYIFKDSYNQHIAWHERKITEATYEFPCEMCNRRFINIDKLQKHKANSHIGQSSLVCHICGRQMRNKTSLELHVKRHSDKREHPCPQCPQSFVYYKELERHVTTAHTKERRYVCNHEGCTKRFNDPYVFKKHMMRHAGLLEKKYHCEYCDKSFTSKYSLDRHILTHTQERPHACQYCSMSYSQKNDLIKHLKEHVGNNIYTCDIEGCTEGFRLKSELREHYAVHFQNNNESN